MRVGEDVWRFHEQRLGYSGREMQRSDENPRNEGVISKTPALPNKTIVVEGVNSKGCNSQHDVGDKFYFDGAGNVLTKLCLQRICFGALHSMPTLVYGAQELFYAGVDPSEMRFKRAGCADVGFSAGGFWDQHGNLVSMLPPNSISP